MERVKEEAEKFFGILLVTPAHLVEALVEAHGIVDKFGDEWFRGGSNETVLSGVACVERCGGIDGEKLAQELNHGLHERGGVSKVGGNLVCDEVEEIVEGCTVDERLENGVGKAKVSLVDETARVGDGSVEASVCICKQTFETHDGGLGLSSARLASRFLAVDGFGGACDGRGVNVGGGRSVVVADVDADTDGSFRIGAIADEGVGPGLGCAPSIDFGWVKLRSSNGGRGGCVGCSYAGSFC